MFGAGTIITNFATFQPNSISKSVLVAAQNSLQIGTSGLRRDSALAALYQLDKALGLFQLVPVYFMFR